MIWSWQSFAELMRPMIGAAIGSSFGSFAAGFWAVYRFRIERRQHYEIQRRESQKPYLEQQLKIYLEVTKVVSQISTFDSEEPASESRKRFWELYWGELSAVETPEIERQMKKIGDLINYLDGCASLCEDGETTDKMDPVVYKALRAALEDLEVPVLSEQQEDHSLNVNLLKHHIKEKIQFFSYDLAHSIRCSIESGWAVELGSNGRLRLTTEERNNATSSAKAEGEGKIIPEIFTGIMHAIARGGPIPPWPHKPKQDGS